MRNKLLLTAVLAATIGLAPNKPANADELMGYACGAPIATQLNVVLIKWGWNGADQYGLEPYLKEYVNLDRSKNLNVLSEYYQTLSSCQLIGYYSNDGAISHYGTVNYNATTPTSNTTKAQAESLVDTVATGLGNPANAVYVLAYPKGVYSPGPANDRCIAYHSATSTGNLYISEPYRVKSTDTGCISTGAGTLQNLTTHDIFHELSELITDPRGTAWYARASNHEVADACELASNMRFFQLAWSNAPNNALAYLAPLSSNATGGKCIFQRSTHINTFALGT